MRTIEVLQNTPRRSDKRGHKRPVREGHAAQHSPEKERAMSGNHANDPAAIRSKLNHPVIDADGHWLEFGPALIEYLRKVGGEGAEKGYRMMIERVGKTLAQTVEE